MQELVADQFSEIRAIPGCLGQKRVHAGQRLEAASKPPRKLLWIRCAAHRLLSDSLHARKRVFDAMIKLAKKKLPGVFRLHLRGNVSEVADSAKSRQAG